MASSIHSLSICVFTNLPDVVILSFIQWLRSASQNTLYAPVEFRMSGAYQNVPTALQSLYLCEGRFILTRF